MFQMSNIIHTIRLFFCNYLAAWAHLSSYIQWLSLITSISLGLNSYLIKSKVDAEGGAFFKADLHFGILTMPILPTKMYF